MDQGKGIVPGIGSIRCPSCNDLDARHHEKTHVDSHTGKATLSLDMSLENLVAHCAYCRLLEDMIRQFAPGVLESREVSSIMLDLTQDSPATAQIVNSGADEQNGKTALFHLCCADQPQNFDLSPPVCSGPFSLRSDADECFEFLEKHLDTCLRSHDKCASQGNCTRLPKRTLYLIENEIRLRETEGLRGRYVALSHCWGKTQVIRTTEENIEQMKTCVSWEKLSRVFQDAVTVCRRVGIDFLWIDSLCIIQDSKADWETESSKMCEYYEHACFTISAASSPNGDTPFLRQRDAKWLPREFQLVDRWGNKQKFLARQCAGSSISQFIEDDGPLATRAWVWQEAILSTRLISYTSSELRWECKEVVSAEDGGLPRGLFSTRLTQQLARCQSRPISGWHELVGTYSIRELSFMTDRLPALAGVASKMNQILQSDYLAGLWRTNLMSDLCWSVDYSVEEALRPRPADYLAPSWAWPSVSGPIAFENYDDYEEVIPLATIVDAQCTVPGLNPYGKVSEGYLVLRARVAHLTVTCHNPNDCWAYTLCKQDSEPEPMAVDCYLIKDADSIRRADDDDTPELGREAVKSDRFSVQMPCISLRKISQDEVVFLFVLVLQKIENGVYSRIGCASLENNEWFENASEAVIRVI